MIDSEEKLIRNGHFPRMWIGHMERLTALTLAFSHKILLLLFVIFVRSW